MKLSTHLTLPLAVGLFAGCSATTPTQEADKTNARQRADAARVILLELRTGHITNAIELLEQQIDVGILATASQLPTLSGEPRQQAESFMTSVREYRIVHPRKAEASLPDTDDIATEMQIARDRATEALNQK